MARVINRNVGMLLLGVWLILTGISGLAPLGPAGNAHGGSGVDCGHPHPGRNVDAAGRHGVLFHR